ncbi:hypothetical protein COHA_007044 [Chlorella ohadii]|uniref:Uncharacterized protein n=1 Tax=Chlorella ohadii TaxID=2649997 RepID=A0AAD5DLP1_9CHLO|nr:hypothetical protein COHA_007044 [Chlorella ohadii]
MLSSTCTAAAAVVGPARLQRPASATRRSPLATQRSQRQLQRHLARAEGEGSGEQAAQQTVPPPAAQQEQQQRQEEEPIWVRRERERAAQQAARGSGDLPFGVYLLFSSFTAIAAIGSIFEYANQHAIFDVIQPDSPLYTPILGFFALTGLPTAGFLFYKAVQSANKAAEQMDKLDGY